MTFKKRVLTSYSEDRLEKLITKRINASDKEKQEIDNHIWNLFGEEWAIMFTDLSGFSRNVAEFGIIHFIQIIFESQRIFIPVIEDNDGILLKVEGDSFMVIFRDPNNALKCSIEMQEILKKYNSFKDDEKEKIFLCLGLGFGKVVRISDDDVFGEEVNSASKLGEDMAKAGEIFVTESFLEKITDKSKYKIEELKEVLPKGKSGFKIIY